MVDNESYVEKFGTALWEGQTRERIGNSKEIKEKLSKLSEDCYGKDFYRELAKIKDGLNSLFGRSNVEKRFYHSIEDIKKSHQAGTFAYGVRDRIIDAYGIDSREFREFPIEFVYAWQDANQIMESRFKKILKELENLVE